jgi:DNA-binding PadR family transcriptional regulator
LPAGTLYPILDRLEREDWVTTELEEIDESSEGRRRRRYYALTPDGRRLRPYWTTPCGPGRAPGVLRA